MKTEFEITEDGSHTLFVPELNEHYHSTHGAVQESMHVYINAGFRQCTKEEIHVLEIGFGTGLNTFLTLLESEKSDKKIVYTSLELYPVSLADARKLNYASQICPEKADVFLQLHESEWEKKVDINSRFSLLKLNRSVTKNDSLTLDEVFDVVYFDAFAPDKQSEMWSQKIFNDIFSICNPNAILTTYCAKGAVRRMLQNAGFEVERLEGPLGKREMLRAQKN
ncbi:MAG: tRNA (5-methylaminomethyl-2-thiouridine)(34)-methyltransferase MnmD [Dysgonamonadaceae bacterium]|jgi:tRNA U34 5-methylaminomethyl-2-thiouridine-forming methyltransferase MnmC|nr:tRNA (5-methylaminomethyl-2-thiouridine)(34)-methyltransferase MnmD [Dysgonamonadaceae bacterium]